MKKLDLFDKKNVLNKTQQKSIIGGMNGSNEQYDDTRHGLRYDVSAVTNIDTCETVDVFTKRRDDRYDGPGIVIDGEEWVPFAEATGSTPR